MTFRNEKYAIMFIHTHQTPNYWINSSKSVSITIFERKIAAFFTTEVPFNSRIGNITLKFIPII